MKTTHLILTTAVGMLLLAGCNDDNSTAKKPADYPPPASSQAAADKPTAVDNSAQNRNDGGEKGVTPFDQGNNEGDLAITRDIRQWMTKDETLSVNAKNVKVITNNRVVVLRGPVENAAEAERIASAARGIAGVARVDNQLAVRQP